MFIDTILILATLIVTVTAIYWQPDQKADLNEKSRTIRLLNKYGQRALLAIAVVTTGCSFWKARQDDKDKDFLQLAVASTLAPANSVYPDLYPHFYSAVKWRPWRLDYNDFRCYHVVALTCFFKNEMNPKYGKKPELERHGTLVLDKTDVGKMYANWIRKSGNDSLAREFANKQFKRDVVNEEILDKVGILGRNIFYHFQNDVYTDYTIDGKAGVTLSSRNGSIVITPSEIITAAHAAAAGDGKTIVTGIETTVAGLKLFYEIEKLYREKFKEIGVTCRRSDGC
ncbi:hypothetical protein [Bradyrhizobium yuanmingense]|uniref:hypothetical protein n=1 Tax=Bradyrhizobium yuanmingense TaxID=108015 RepID=UPI0023B9F3A6|nr:hypothetical protein [Bradyrhizobium yuanmingense]MDF0495344.1 hypothetical protein [Bradyrhizobium yuanmingense]